jgi:large subunit ribosomal protein L15
MQLHQLTRKTPNKKSVQVGRGGKRGKTAGRGTKGQNARSNTRKRPELRDIIKKIPKKRGHGKNRAKSNYDKPEMVTVNISVLEKLFDNGATVSPVTLLEKGILKSSRLPKAGVKLLGTGDLTKKLIISGCDVSAGAKTKIESAGGSIA